MPWPQDAYVGQKVVCVDASKPTIPHPCGDLSFKSIYTVSEIRIEFNSSVIYVGLFEFSISGFHVCNAYWRASRFRPVQSTSTSYSLLAKLQDPSTHKVRQDQFDKELIDG